MTTKRLLFLLLLVSVMNHPLPAQEKQVMYLSGKGSNDAVSWDFFCTSGRNSGYWTKIPVPSCWELLGFGNYNYGRDYKTYGKNFRFFDEKGFYKKDFTLPASWKGKKVFIVFEGSMTDTEVKINGQLAGTPHQGAFYEFRYDITDKIKREGSNLLEVSVSKMSADASVNNAERLADYWIFGGIFRPVYLETVPGTFIDRVAIDAKADGTFATRLFLKGIGTGVVAEVKILDLTGKLIASATEPLRAQDSAAVIRTRVDHPRLWTAETPFLYSTVISLKQGTTTLYRSVERFGFRTIEVRRGDGIYINGVQVKMKGINRHCFWPETGRTLNDNIQLMDLGLIKEMNMNAVRCSHYPPDKKFLDLCDSLGLYVLDELAGWQKYYSTAAGLPLVKEMVLRDCNHPSVIFWDNGNEGGTNKELDKEFYRWDFSQRTVIHPHHRPGNDFNGIDCNHYEDYYSTQKILSDSLIYMPTEFLHSQDDGGGGAALDDFWELHWHAKRSGGGFIWALLDEGVRRTDMNGNIDVNGVNAPDGVLGPHREKEGSFYAIREIYSPVKIKMKAWPPDFNGAIPVENRYHFTNLRECRFAWQLVNYKNPSDWDAGYTVVKNAQAPSPSIAPTDSGQLNLGLPPDYKSYDALLLSAYDPFNALIYRWTWRLKTNKALLGGIVQMIDSAQVVSSQTDTSLLLRSGGISITFSKKTGAIIDLRSSHGDKLSFGGLPQLVGGVATFTGLKDYAERDGHAVELLYEGAVKLMRWKMFNGGWVSLQYSYDILGSVPFAGISFSYPENYVLGAKWLGKGPYRVWKNRPQGVTDNVWQNMNNSTQTGSAPWVFPEFKGYYADICWMEMNTVEGKFLMATPDSGLFFRLFDFYGLSGVKPAPELPPGNISFLDAIPPIGTKLALNISNNTAALGPQSEQARMEGPVQHTLYFYFGLSKTAGATGQYKVPVKDELF